MSFDLAVWHAPKRPTADEAGHLYVALCDSRTDGVAPHPAVDAFYNELVARYREIETVPDALIDDTDYCPWSCALDRSPGHVVMACVWSEAENVEQFVRDLAGRHGLTVYDPQYGHVHYPDDKM